MKRWYATRMAIMLGVVVMAMAACRGNEAAPTIPPPTSTSVVTSTSVAELVYMPQAGDGTPVVVDYNPTSSDIAALLYLLQHPGVRVDAITIPGTGESRCEAAVANTLGLLVLVGEEGIPVACGSSVPMGGENEWPEAWREAADELPGLDLPPGGEPSALNGPELLVAAVTSSAEPVKLLTLGPLTNVAEALTLDPTLITNLEAVYIMGGAVEVGGNVFANDFAEWNIWIDPVGAQAVLESGAPVVLVALDATNDVPVTSRWVDQLAENRASPAATAVVDLFNGSPGVLEGGFYFWDELAAAVLTDHTYVVLSDATVMVVVDGPEQGRTKPVPDGAAVQVAVGADAFRFERDLLSVLNGGRPLGAVVADPELVAYFGELETIGAILNTTIERWFLENEGVVDVLFEPENADTEQVRRVFRSFLAVFMEALRNDHALTQVLVAPAVAAEAHDGYLAAVQDVISREPDLFAEINSADPSGSGDPFESIFFDMIDAITTACSDLQSLAAEEGINVELACSAE